MNTTHNPSKDENTSLGLKPGGQEKIFSTNSRPLEVGDIIGMGRGEINANMEREAHFGAEWGRERWISNSGEGEHIFIGMRRDTWMGRWRCGGEKVHTLDPNG